jgi:hypothetical protein
MTQSTAAEHIGIKPPHFANILNGKKYLPPHKLNAFEWVVGNRALSMTIERFRKTRRGARSSSPAPSRAPSSWPAAHRWPGPRRDRRCLNLWAECCGSRWRMPAGAADAAQKQP